MKPIYTALSKSILLSIGILLLANDRLSAQACAAAASDNQSTYGTNNVWIGYVYTGTNFNNYQGHVTEGSSTSPNFYENFGGQTVTYPTSGCSITTNGFSVRYRLTQAFSGNYTFTVGGDDGYRFSLDGGATWVVNVWYDHTYATTPYTVTLNGTYNLVFEYYENGGDNIASFNVVQNCYGTDNPNVYGSGNVWNGYLYQDMTMTWFKGTIFEGSAAGPNFDENFGNTTNSNTTTINTNACPVTSYQFSARFRRRVTLISGTYVFTVGGDDGYRFSLDGGSTWAINNWNDHSYTTTTYSANLSGLTAMVLEYYDNGGASRVSFVQTATVLPVTLTTWSVSALDNNQAQLKWTATDAINFDHFVVQRSTDGANFEDVGTVAAVSNASSAQSYSYTDTDNWDGKLYYRLKMVDIDGKENYSNITSISLQSAQTLRIYPTVVESGSFIVETAHPIQQARLELFDMSGRRLQVDQWPVLEGRQQVTVNNSGSLPAGAYIARLSNGQTTLAKQVIVIRNH